MEAQKIRESRKLSSKEENALLECDDSCVALKAAKKKKRDEEDEKKRLEEEERRAAMQRVPDVQVRKGNILGNKILIFTR